MAVIRGKETLMSQVRAFIACDIPDLFLEKISSVQDGLKGLDADVTWTKTGGIHITLKFLGDIEEGYIDKVAAVIEDASKGQTPFEIYIKGSGAFPNLKNPRVVWIGVEDLNKGLMHIQQALDGGLKALGFEPEEREFRPHLTLGRVKGVKGKERLSSAVSGLKDIEIGSFTVDRVILYKSELKPTGAVYTKLREVILQKNVETGL
ncbi:MAG: RNA 2',3'-cyclic phosphodiesterase [Deltaproteobacteria bacterium]|nr:RNA 2',3'-cyclic phosphodiesterase [Deltaproteobacteria bacterium]